MPAIRCLCDIPLIWKPDRFAKHGDFISLIFLVKAMSINVTKMADDEVEVLLSTEEGHFVDLKAVDISPASVTKAVSAFANTAGGELFIGVDELIGDAGRERTWRRCRGSRCSRR